MVKMFQSLIILNQKLRRQTDWPKTKEYEAKMVSNRMLKGQCYFEDNFSVESLYAYQQFFDY